jgi:hypothetical protein
VLHSLTQIGFSQIQLPTRNNPAFQPHCFYRFWVYILASAANFVFLLMYWSPWAPEPEVPYDACGLCLKFIFLLFTALTIVHSQYHIQGLILGCERLKIKCMFYYIDKMSLCFKWAPRHGGVLGSGGIDLHILDLGTRWRWVVSFAPWPLYSQGKNPWYLLDRRPGGPQNRSGGGGEEKNSQPLPGIESLIIQPVAQRYTTELSCLPVLPRFTDDLPC